MFVNNICSNQLRHNVCFDCQKIFFKNSFSQRCSQCYDSIDQKLQKYNPEELLRLNHPIL